MGPSPGGGNDHEVAWSYAKATGGRNTIRRSGMTYPSTDALTYTYLSTGNSLDDSMSRLTRITHGATLVAAYTYLGDGVLVSTELPEPNVISGLNGASTGSYTQVDRFNRVIDSRWLALTPNPDVLFYNVDLTYDRNSNILTAEDQVHSGFDVAYTIDNLDRLVDADEGTLGGATTRKETWTLSQTGNWADNLWDYNGDADYLDVGAADTDRDYDTVTYNDANEQTARTVLWGDGDATPTTTTYSTIAYDAAGNLTDDKWNYKYEYDAWNRLRLVKNQSDNLVAEFTYNGLGHRTGWHYDVDGDGTVEDTADDPWMYFAYDDRWRIVATFWGSASPDAPTEQLAYHNAGLDGTGGSSYIDLVVLRDRDTNGDPTALEERVYYCHNWRADVSALLTDTGKMLEWVKYTAYGVPFGLPAGDTDSDGDWDATDAAAITGGYDVRKDADLDGTITAASDVAHANSITGTYQTLGRNVMTSTGVESRKGYAGYELDPSLWGNATKGRTFWHVRHRVLDSGLGRWVQRDPAGYVDGVSLYEYVGGMPNTRFDPSGLCARSCAACVVSLLGAGISTVGLSACAVPEPAFSKAACRLALAGLGAGLYGAFDSCVACAACVVGGDDDDSESGPDPKPDPGRPPTPGEQCVGSATNGGECGMCCLKKYRRDTNACFNDPANDPSTCPRWPWWRHRSCANRRERSLSNCLNDAGRAYNECWRTCYDAFPPQDPMPWWPPINPQKDLKLPKPTNPACSSSTCGIPEPSSTIRQPGNSISITQQ